MTFKGVFCSMVSYLGCNDSNVLLCDNLTPHLAAYSIKYFTVSVTIVQTQRRLSPKGVM